MTLLIFVHQNHIITAALMFWHISCSAGAVCVCCGGRSLHVSYAYVFHISVTIMADGQRVWADRFSFDYKLLIRHIKSDRTRKKNQTFNHRSHTMEIFNIVLAVWQTIWFICSGKTNNKPMVFILLHLSAGCDCRFSGPILLSDPCIYHS